MKYQNYEDLETDQLIKKKSRLKAMLYTFVGILSLIFLIGLIISFTKGFSTAHVVFIVLPFALAALMASNYKELKNIDKELANRTT